MRLPRQYERREQHALSRPTGILYNVQQAHVKEGLKHDDLHPSAVVCPDVDNIKTPALQRPLIEAAGYRPQHVLQMRASSSAASFKSIGRADEQHQYVNPEIAHTIIHIDRWSIGTFENITNFLFPSQKVFIFGNRTK